MVRWCWVNFQCRGVTVGQGPIALAVGAGGGVWTFLLSSILSLLSLPHFDTVFQSISGRLPKRGRKRRERIDESINVQTTPSRTLGWSGGAMVLGKLPVPGRPTIWVIVGQGPIALAVGAGGE